MHSLPTCSVFSKNLFRGLFFAFCLSHGIDTSAQCPDNEKILNEVHYNKELGIDRQKELLDEAIHCCETKLPDKTAKEKNSCAYAYQKLGNLLLKIGELEGGREMLETAERMYADPRLKKKPATDLGHFHGNQGDWQKAANIYRKIISSGPLEEQLPAALNLVDALLELEEIENAEYWWSLIWPFRDNLGGYRFYFYLLKASIEQAKGNIGSAYGNFQQAKDFARIDFGENSLHYAKVCLSLGEEHFLPQKKYPEALHAFQEALIAYVPGFESRNPLIPPPAEKLQFIDDDIMTILKLKASTFFQQYKDGAAGPEVLDAALGCFGLIVETETSLRQFYETETADFRMIADRHETMELAMEISFELYRETGQEKYIDKALHFSELVKDILLKESIKEIEGSASGLIPQHLAEERNRLKSEFRVLAAEKAGGAPQHILNEKERALKEAWKDHLRELQKGYKRYFKFKYEYVDCSVARIRNVLLSRSQALVEYFIGEKKSYAIAVTDSRAAFVEIPIIVADSTYLQEFISHITGNKEKNRRRDLYEIKAVELFNYLIAPIKEKLDLPERLLIVPDGNLAKLPFDALVEQKANGHEKSFLIERHVSSLAYSASLMLSRGKTTYQNELDYLGIAPVIFSNEEDKMPLSLEEVKAAQTILSGDLLLFEDANKPNLISMAGQYKIVHLATHAVFDKKYPYPYIMLYETEKLALPEIYNLNLNADLVILSS